MNEFNIILESLDIIFQAKLWDNAKPSHILKVLLHMNNKGWLYVPSVNNTIRAVIGAYRIPNVNPDSLRNLPNEESGNILYIPFIVNLSKDKDLFKVIRESMRIYLNKNKNIKEIVLEDMNKKLIRYKIGVKNGKE